MSYNVTLDRKLPTQGVYDQLMGGHIDDRKLFRLYPMGNSGPYSPNGPDRIKFRLPDQGHIDTLRSYMTFTVRVYADQSLVRSLENTVCNDITGTVVDGLNSINRASSEAYYDPGAFTYSRKDPQLRDTCAYMLGGTNGSSGSVFSRFRILLDSEQMEDIEQYHGLTAALNTNIPDTYRSSAAGHLQFLNPRGARETILNALVRGGSCLTQTMTKTGNPISEFGFASGYNTENLVSTRNEIKKTVNNHFTVTEYKNLMHLPTSGIMSNPKMLPTKFMAPVDLEFTCAPTHEAIQIASGFACNKLVSTYVGAYVNGPCTLRMRGLSSASQNGTGQLMFFAQSSQNIGRQLWNYIQRVLMEPIGGVLNATNRLEGSTPNDWVINDKFCQSIRYEIVDPVYHVELVYMSESYDAAFSEALTRGVTFAYETYAFTNSTLRNNGIVTIPINKTSVKSILTGFTNSTTRDSLMANSWHFVNPDIDHYQFRFGNKVIPAEPVKVYEDIGLESLMLYLKSVGLRYEAHAGLNTGWSAGGYTALSETRVGEEDMVNPAVVSNTFGSSEPGPNTWCLGTGRSPPGSDVYRLFGDYPATANVNTIAQPILQYFKLQDPRDGFDGVPIRTPNVLPSYKNLLISAHEYGVGTFLLGLELEAEQDALSGINTSGSTAMMEWDLHLESAPKAPMYVSTWIRYDKALRLEPFGQVSVILD